MGYSPAQQTAMAVLPKISSLFSLFGSFWIFIEVMGGKVTNGTSNGNSNLRSSRNVQSDNSIQKRRHPYHRLLLAMSIYDILESVWNFGSTWPIPADTPSEAGAFWQPAGTTQTCTAQGFFLMLSVAVPMYNAFLSLYYLLVINYRCTDTYIRRWIEPTMHIVAFVWAFGTSLSASVMGYMNNANLWCWIAPFPSDCLVEGNGVECIRGKRTFLLRWVYYFGPLWLSIIASTVFTFMVYWYVRKIDMKSLRYRVFSDDSRFASGVSQLSRNVESSGANNSSHFEVSEQFQEGGSDQLNNNDNDNNISIIDDDDDENDTLQASSSRSPMFKPTDGPTVCPVETGETIPEDTMTTTATATDSCNQQPAGGDRRRYMSKGRVSFMGASVQFGGSSTWGLQQSGDASNCNNNSRDRDDNTGSPFGEGQQQDGSSNTARNLGQRSTSNVSNVSPTTRKRRFVERWKRRQEEQRNMNRRTIEVFHQALFYLGAFYLTHIWSTSNRIIQHLNGGNTIFGLILIHSFFDPFQGFLNFFVYQRPRYLRVRKDHPEWSRWHSMKQVLRFSFWPDPADDVKDTEALSRATSPHSPRQQPPEVSTRHTRKDSGTGSLVIIDDTPTTTSTMHPRNSIVLDMNSNLELPILEHEEEEDATDAELEEGGRAVMEHRMTANNSSRCNDDDNDTDTSTTSEVSEPKSECHCDEGVPSTLSPSDVEVEEGDNVRAIVDSMDDSCKDEPCAHSKQCMANRLASKEIPSNEHVDQEGRFQTMPPEGVVPVDVEESLF